jgi:hypothetical protein
MKKSELRQIIREEVNQALKEGAVKDFFKGPMNAADVRGWIKNPKLSDDEKRNKIKSVMKDPNKFNDLMDAFTGELKAIKEYGSESMYYSAPGGSEQIRQVSVPRTQHFTDFERWKIVAMQLGATIQDRGEDAIAVMPNQDVLGSFVKQNKVGELYLYTS